MSTPPAPALPVPASPAARHSTLPRQKLFFGWHVVGAAFVVAVLGWGIGFYGPPVFLHAVRDAHGWSLALVSGAVTLHFLAGGIVVLNLPALHRRFGVAGVTRAGGIVLSAGVLGWACAAEPWQLLLASIVSGVGWVTLAAAAINAIVSPWFQQRRPAALAMAYNGGSIGGVLFSPLWVAAIGWLGFPMAALVVGAVTIVLLWWLAARYLAPTPDGMGLLPDGEAGAAPAASAAPVRAPLPGKALWGDRRFRTLAAGMALGLFAQIGLIAHLFSLLVPALGAQAAGLLMGAATAAAIGGRTIVGWAMPVDADRRKVAAASYALQIVGSLVLLAAGGSDAVLLIAGVLLFGAGIGNATSLPPIIAQAEFAREDVPRVVATIVAISQAGYAFAAVAFGLLRTLSDGDAAGAAPAVFVAAAMLQALAIAALWVGRR